MLEKYYCQILAMLVVYVMLPYSYAADIHQEIKTIQLNRGKTSIPPFSMALTGDEFASDGYLISTSAEGQSISILRTGWEDGFSFHSYVGENWSGIGGGGVNYSPQFEVGYFTERDALNITLYENIDDVNFYGMDLPAMPRLFEWKSGRFNEIAISCSPVLKSFFSSKMSLYVLKKRGAKIPAEDEAFRRELVKAEQERLDIKCGKFL